MPAVTQAQVASAGKRVTLDAKRLSAAITRVVEHKRELTGLVLQKATAEVVAEIQRKSPVDTGRFRGGWTPYLQSLGLPSDIPSTDTRAVAEGAAMSGYDDQHNHPTDPHITITNGVPYGPELEAGKSNQAGAGFVAETLARLGKHLNRAAREINRPGPKSP